MTTAEVCIKYFPKFRKHIEKTSIPALIFIKSRNNSYYHNMQKRQNFNNKSHHGVRHFKKIYEPITILGIFLDLKEVNFDIEPHRGISLSLGET